MDDTPGITSDAPSEDPVSAPTAPVPPEEKRAEWTYFLTPLAVVIGSVIIAAAIWWVGRDDGADPAAVATPAPATTGNFSSASDPAPAGARPTTLRDAFTSYAKQVAIDEGKFFQCLGKPETVGLLNTHLQRGFALGVNGTPTFFINNKMVVGSQPGAIFDEVIAAELKGSPSSLDGYSDAIKQLANSGRFKIINGRVDVSDATIEGNRDARVMIAEFSDFQCPFCRRWIDENMQRMRTKLGNDIALAFIHFPIVQIHPNAGNASAAAICAGEQGKFWQMHDLLFNKQEEWQELK